jgi:hypothetical protein
MEPTSSEPTAVPSLSPTPSTEASIPVQGSADLAESYAANQNIRPVASQNWGLDSTRSLPPFPPRLVITLVVLLLLLVASPFIFMQLRPTDTVMKDDAYYALEAYSRAVSSGASLESALSEAERTLISAASRLESKDGSLLVLRGEFGCWGVPTTPATKPASPQQLDSGFCP